MSTYCALEMVLPGKCHHMARCRPCFRTSIGSQTMFFFWALDQLYIEGVSTGPAIFSTDKKTRANCSRKVREIEFRSWEMWLGWQGWRMIICKRLNPPDDHLQEAWSSEWSFASGRILQMITCKRLDPPDNHMQEIGFAGCWMLERICCKWPDD